MCSTQASSQAVELLDLRDNQLYTVRYINGNCWMTRNLTIGCNGSSNSYGASISSKTLTSEYSNVDTTWSTPTTVFNSSNNSPNTSTGYTTPAMQCSSTYGAWYNYAAATAGTILNTYNYTDATKDICPAGWRLPTNSEQSSITSYASDFSPAIGGYYNYGGYYATSIGLWWSATPSDVSNRYDLLYSDSSFYTNAGDRYIGAYVRCLRSS